MTSLETLIQSLKAEESSFVSTGNPVGEWDIPWAFGGGHRHYDCDFKRSCLLLKKRKSYWQKTSCLWFCFRTTDRIQSTCTTNFDPSSSSFLTWFNFFQRFKIGDSSTDHFSLSNLCATTSDLISTLSCPITYTRGGEEKLVFSSHLRKLFRGIPVSSQETGRRGKEGEG